VTKNATSFGGERGNPQTRGGRPRSLLRRIGDQHGDNVVELVGVLIKLGHGEIPDGYENSEIKTSDRIRAIEVTLDRLLGKPLQSVDLDASVGLAPEHVAIMAALKLTPHERRQELEVPEDAENEH
jgi:hypothetical protein